MIRLRRTSARRGVVLLAVLIIVVLLTLAAYKYHDWMFAEARATQASIRANQAKAFAASGVHYAAALLASGQEALGGSPFNNPGLFQNIEVPTAPNARPGRFSILSLSTPDEITNGNASFRFGVTCESSKINLNGLLALDRNRGEAGRKLLMGLPNMSEDIANAILDWLDPDETPRTSGAENDYYGTLDPPYRCKNGPLDSLEELLLVRGVTPQLLFGNDRNRNGILDPDEDDGSGQANLGWQAYLTIYSRELNVDPEYNPRINLNKRDAVQLKDQLTAALGEELTTYIMAYKLYGGSSTSSTSGNANANDGAAEVKAKVEEDLAKSGTRRLQRIRSVWDLVNSQVNVTIGTGNSQKKVTYPSPLNDSGQQRQLLPLLLQYCTTSNNMDLTPRININTASQTVLLALREAAGVQESDLMAIVNQRTSLGDAANADGAFTTTAWLLTDANLPVATIKKLDPYITSQSQVFRLQSVGYFDQGGPVARVEAVIDINQGRPRIIYYRDLSELGKGFNLSGN